MDGDNFVRYTNLKHPVGYCDAVESGTSLRFESETLSVETLRVERIMLGLRMNSGVSRSELALPQASLEKLIGRGWIDQHEDRVALSPQGRHFCSEVALELI
jgi:oxygen-independent coproporphyrinogen-3 oxidase